VELAHLGKVTTAALMLQTLPHLKAHTHLAAAAGLAQLVAQVQQSTNLVLGVRV
jgi:hypothetical protein